MARRGGSPPEVFPRRYKFFGPLFLAPGNRRFSLGISRQGFPRLLRVGFSLNKGLKRFGVPNFLPKGSSRKTPGVPQGGRAYFFKGGPPHCCRRAHLNSGLIWVPKYLLVQSCRFENLKKTL